ncbi:MAG: glucan biosynthesis protein, partial [Hyphomicrobium sp.]
MSATTNRRQLLQGAAGFSIAASLAGWPGYSQAGNSAAAADLGPAEPFSFATLQARAEALAKTPFVKPAVPSPETLADIDYDQYQQIRYRAGKSLKLDGDGRMPVQLFHLGKYATDPVRMHVVADGRAREVIYTPGLFDIPEGHPAKRLEAGAGFAGFRVMAADQKTDWFAAMGASYFRTSGPYNQYGLS